MCTTKIHAQTKLDQLIFQVSRLADELAQARGMTSADLPRASLVGDKVEESINASTGSCGGLPLSQDFITSDNANEVS